MKMIIMFVIYVLTLCKMLLLRHVVIYFVGIVLLRVALSNLNAPYVDKKLCLKKLFN